MGHVLKPEEEDAAQLLLGEEFDKVKCLMTSEVAIILERRLQDVNDEAGDSNLPPMFHKTNEYVQKFNRFKSKANVDRVRGLLENKGLEEFEMAQLANLNPETPEEAKILIPSLEKRFEDEDITTLLQDLATLRRFK
eukprot:GFYU01012281.1.p2 GENE.GFYU01012281.1~~GFYU01012281.1.p2  ORF type:complete len:137 (-),score=33.30 GFYU01012281.1:60-470(-)